PRALRQGTSRTAAGHRRARTIPPVGALRGGDRVPADGEHGVAYDLQAGRRPASRRDGGLPRLGPRRPRRRRARARGAGLPPRRRALRRGHHDGIHRDVREVVRAPRRALPEHHGVPRPARGTSGIPEDRGRLIRIAVALVLLRAASALALSGEEVYRDRCPGCHGGEGRGGPAGSGITVPLPDFTDCVTATGETTANWVGLVRRGGRFLGLSDEMPAFGDVLTDAEILAVIAYVRGFCATPGYPPGDLNLPRPVFVEKAFPEDEVVASFDHEEAHDGRASAWETAIEKRLGPRGQVELAVPGAVVDPNDGNRRAGIGDVGVSYKYAFLADPRWHSIV